MEPYPRNAQAVVLSFHVNRRELLLGVGVQIQRSTRNESVYEAPSRPKNVDWGQAADLPFCPYASFNFAISNFFILRNASVTRAIFFLSLSLSISSITVGTICHERPYLSFSH